MTKKSFDDYGKKSNEVDVISTDQQQILNIEKALSNVDDYEKAKREMGFFAKAKQTKEQNMFLLEKAKLENRKKLELIKYELIKNAEANVKIIDRRTEYLIEQIDKQYLAHIKELKAGNYEERNRLQIRLAKLSQQLFTEVNESDFADFLKTDLIKRIIDERKILADEIGLIKEEE